MSEFDLNAFINPVTGMRFQSQLGKQMERRYKKGQNVVKLSMARVVKVNYKYNTVDVVTTLHRNSTAKNPTDEGRFSAKLPVAFGGTTPEGKPYGSNTLATVGSLVLLGFLEGDKDHPIVLNIYGETDNQSRLTRTTFSSADESQEELQRELWQLFTLYPSMTYKNIDGNGNQEVTFSGKTFLISTDNDPDNDYINDAEFDYDLLPNARYSDGELIEPKSPDAPTVLYVHQGVYGDHRVTFFIKSDGTVRLGSRHSSGEGITFMELGTDGAFHISQKRDTTDPEDESEKFSKIGINDDGTVTLESVNHKLEVNEKGVFIDGLPIASIIGGGGGDGNFEDIWEAIEGTQTSITILDGKIESKIGRTEYEDGIDEAKKYTESSFTQLADKISEKVSSETLTSAISDVNSKIAGVESGLSKDIDDVANRLDDVSTNVTYTAKITSTNGTNFKNGEIDTMLFCQVKQSNSDITDHLDAAVFNWTRISDNPTADAAWNNARGQGVKSIHITDADIVGRASFDCDVVTDDFDVTAQVTIVDISDTSSLDDATKLTRYKRSLVRADLSPIVGRYLDSNETMPTIATLDTNQVGQVYALRKSARDVGMAISNTMFVNFENAYNGLRTYLESITPKPWDINSTGVAIINPTDWESKWNEYRLRYVLLNAEVQKRQIEYADAVGDKSVKDAIKAVSNSNQFETKAITNPMTITSPIASVGLPEFQGRHVISTATTGKKIVPITSPSFTTGGTLTLYAKFFGDGTTNDSFSWDILGRAIKVKHWDDADLNGSLAWEFGSDRVGYKVVKVAAYAPSVIDNSAIVANSQNTLLTTVGTITAANQVKLTADDRTLYIALPDSYTGWGEGYTPSTDEIKAFFNGWRMCNGTFSTPYNSTGSKVWYPIGDTDLSRSTQSGSILNPVPSTDSASLQEGTISRFQVVYRLDDPIQEVVTFDGILPLIEGDNTVNITYPVDTPAITSGYVRYAINLATVTDTLKYIIPVLQNRISKAEEVITDESITNTVMNSISYQFAMASKANTSDLEGYATKDEVDEKIKEGIDGIDFEPYVTQSQLKQTQSDITAMFTTGGGVNIFKNSVGYAGLDFWTADPNTGTVETVSNIELDTLGFGSGFLFNPDGKDKGIVQELSVVPNQPYTLSWYLNKQTAGADDSYRFAIEILENDIIVKELANNSADTTVGYLANYFTYTPLTDKIKVRFKGYGNVSATLSGLMMSIGEVPLRWSLATGEVYNTNVRMDIKGIRVSQLDANRNEVGYTQITPEEFAGYHLDENNQFEKVFYQNGDETVAKRLRSEDEITMGNVKIINVESTNWNGWAFVANQE